MFLYLFFFYWTCLSFLLNMPLVQQSNLHRQISIAFFLTVFLSVCQSVLLRLSFCLTFCLSFCSSVWLDVWLVIRLHVSFLHFPSFYHISFIFFLTFLWYFVRQWAPGGTRLFTLVNRCEKPWFFKKLLNLLECAVRKQGCIHNSISHVWVGRGSDGGMDGWMEGRTDGWTDRQTNSD